MNANLEKKVIEMTKKEAKEGNKEIYNNTDNLIDKNINRDEFIF